MRLRCDIVGCFALVIAATPQHARGDDTVPLRLRYAVPPACPSADAFLAEVVARTARARAAAAEERATSLQVDIRAVPGGHAGKLELIEPDTTHSVREVSAADCQQVVAALAFMTALAIDPNAVSSPARSEPVSPRPAPVVRAPVARPASARFGFALGLQLEAIGGVVEDPLVLVRPFVQLARETDSRFSYALRLSASRGHARVLGPQGNGDFSVWLARVEPCPLRLSFVRGALLSVCMLFDAGRLEATGRNVVPSLHVARPWLSLGGAARVEWELLDILMLEAGAELFAPIVRDRFFVGSDATFDDVAPALRGGATFDDVAPALRGGATFDDVAPALRGGATLHRAPAIAAGASIGAGVRFP